VGIATGTHKTYMPQIARLRHPRHQGVLLCLYLDTTLGFRGVKGAVRAEMQAPSRAGRTPLPRDR
jgi:hypothetical protein